MLSFVIFALFKDPARLVLLIFFKTNKKIEQHKTKKKSTDIFFFLLQTSFFDLRVNNRVVVIINYPHKVNKTNKTV